MSQVNFFMLASDEDAFFEMLMSRHDTLAYEGRFFLTQEPNPLVALPSLPDIRNHENFITLVHVNLRKDYPPSPVQSGPFEGKFAFESYRSAHIEWHRSVRTSEHLISGRIFAKIGWLESAEDNESFRSWYSSIERWLKKRLQRIDSTWWVASDALKWSKDGGLLAFGGELAAKRSLHHDAT